MIHFQVEKLKESFDLKEKQEGEKLAVGTQVAKDSGGKDHEAMWAELANLGGIADYQVLKSEQSNPLV